MWLIWLAGIVLLGFGSEELFGEGAGMVAAGIALLWTVNMEEVSQRIKAK